MVLESGLTEVSKVVEAVALGGVVGELVSRMELWMFVAEPVVVGVGSAGVPVASDVELGGS